MYVNLIAFHKPLYQLDCDVCYGCVPVLGDTTACLLFLKAAIIIYATAYRPLL